MHTKKYTNGQSLFEVVVAVAVTALIITAIVALASNSIQNSSFSKDKTLAAGYVQDINEWLRQQRDSNLDTFLTNVQVPTWCFKNMTWSLSRACSSTDYITGTKFVRETNFTINTIDGKEIILIDTTVYWQDAKGIHQVTDSTELSDL